MRIFVLTTGRSASTTFARACVHVHNYTVGHESRWTHLGAARLDYPDNHIEIDNRLSWLLGRLDERFGSNAFYVHLQRDRQAVARSYFSRRLGQQSIIRAYSFGILYRKQVTLQDCEDYYDTVNANIRLFLRDKPGQLTFDTSNAGRDFRAFWDTVGAEGDLEAALAEWQVLHNTGNDTAVKRSSGCRALRKLKRTAVQLPDFLKNA